MTILVSMCPFYCFGGGIKMSSLMVSIWWNRYITPEQVPIQYGGMSVDFCECHPEFAIDEPAIEITVRPATKQIVEILVNEVRTAGCSSNFFFA